MTISSILLLSFSFIFSLFPHYPTFSSLARISKAVLLRRGLLFAYALFMFHTLSPISLSFLVFSGFSLFSLALFFHHAIFSSIRPKRSPQRSSPLSFFLPSLRLWPFPSSTPLSHPLSLILVSFRTLFVLSLPFVFSLFVSNVSDGEKCTLIWISASLYSAML